MEDMNGWVRLYRSMASCKTASRGLNFFGAMAWLIAKAQYEETWYNGDKIGRGQLFCGLNHLAKEWKIGMQSVRTILRHLEDDGFLTSKSTSAGRIITICNYDTYQMPIKPDQQGNQQTPNKRLTNAQQTTNNLQEYKERKEIKEERECAGAGAAQNISLSLDSDLESEMKKIPANIADLFRRWVAVWELQHGNGKTMNGFTQEGQFANLLRIPEPERENALKMAIAGCWKNIRQPDTGGTKHGVNAQNLELYNGN